jgi:hypothetical protein
MAAPAVHSVATEAHTAGVAMLLVEKIPAARLPIRIDPTLVFDDLEP